VRRTLWVSSCWMVPASICNCKLPLHSARSPISPVFRPSSDPWLWTPRSFLTSATPRSHRWNALDPRLSASICCASYPRTSYWVARRKVLLCITGENEQPFRKVANRDFDTAELMLGDSRR
jgi:hypothetical protein